MAERVRRVRFRTCPNRAEHRIRERWSCGKCVDMRAMRWFFVPGLASRPFFRLVFERRPGERERVSVFSFNFQAEHGAACYMRLMCTRATSGRVGGRVLVACAAIQPNGRCRMLIETEMGRLVD